MSFLPSNSPTNQHGRNDRGSSSSQTRGRLRRCSDSYRDPERMATQNSGSLEDPGELWERELDGDGQVRPRRRLTSWWHSTADAMPRDDWRATSQEGFGLQGGESRRACSGLLWRVFVRSPPLHQAFVGAGPKDRSRTALPRDARSPQQRLSPHSASLLCGVDALPSLKTAPVPPAQAFVLRPTARCRPRS